MSFAQSSEDLEKERLQLEKERRIYDETYQNLQQQINSLTSTLVKLQSSGVDDDKLEDIEEQLEELREDLSNLEELEYDLIEREDVFAENYSDVPATTSDEAESDSAIPPWFKSNAKWWKQGLISDGDIINALENLIIQDVIPLDNFVKASSGIEHVAGVQKGGTFTIPTYQKDVFGFWSDGLVSDDEIVNSIGHLMTQGIINSAKIQGEIAERQAKFDQKMAEIDSALDKSLKNIETEKSNEDGTTTIVNSDGSVTILFPDDSSTQFFTDGSRYTTLVDDGSHGLIWSVAKGKLTASDGTVTTTFDDSIRTYFDDGTYIIYSPDSKIITKHIPYGKDRPAYEMNSNQFLSSTTFDDGKTTTTYIDGTIIEVYPNNEIITIRPDGKKITSHPEQAVFNPYGDGGVLWPSGYVIEKGSIDTFSGDASVMEQLIQVTVLTIDGIQFPISQFTIWKWTGECDDAWHYHTPTSQAIAIDGVTGIIDPDQENCGFGKVGEVQVSTTFMSKEQIEKFRDRTDSDPLTNEAMTGGSDDGAAPVNVNPGPASVEESDNGMVTTSSKSKILTDFDDSDGDGISDEIDDSPLVSTTFGSLGNGLPGEILDLGGLEVRIIGGEGFGAISIEITDDGSMFKTYEDGKSPFAIISVLGIEFEFEPGIYEFSFG